MVSYVVCKSRYYVAVGGGLASMVDVLSKAKGERWETVTQKQSGGC